MIRKRVAAWLVRKAGQVDPGMPVVVWQPLDGSHDVWINNRHVATFDKDGRKR